VVKMEVKMLVLSWRLTVTVVLTKCVHVALSVTALEHCIGNIADDATSLLK